jgi:integrase
MPKPKTREPRRLADAYTFPGFRPLATVRGLFGDPQARQRKHREARATWSREVHRYVFVYRSRAPIHQLTTRARRDACASVGLSGMTFHTMRHT